MSVLTVLVDFNLNRLEDAMGDSHGAPAEQHGDQLGSRVVCIEVDQDRRYDDCQVQDISAVLEVLASISEDEYFQTLVQDASGCLC